MHTYEHPRFTSRPIPPELALQPRFLENVEIVKRQTEFS